MTIARYKQGGYTVSDKGYKNPVCRGSWVLGNNCKTCERCVESWPVSGSPNIEREIGAFACKHCGGSPCKDPDDTGHCFQAKPIAVEPNELVDRLQNWIGVMPPSTSGTAAPESESLTLLRDCLQAISSKPDTIAISRDDAKAVGLLFRASATRAANADNPASARIFESTAIRIEQALGEGNEN